MSTLLLILIIALVTSITECQHDYVSCIRELEDTVVKYRSHVVSSSRDAYDKIDEVMANTMFNESVYWNTFRVKVTSMVDFEFDESFENYRINYPTTVNDKACREFQKKFPLDLVRKCSTFEQNSCLVDKVNVLKKFNDVIKYIDRIKVGNNNNETRTKSDEESCKEKIERVKEVSMMATLWIQNTAYRARTRMTNFVGRLSYCLMNRSNRNASLISEWRNACSYYDNVV